MPTIYFLKTYKDSIPIGDNSNFLHLINTFIESNYKVKPIFTQETKKELQKQSGNDGIYITKDMSVYKKTEKMSQGFFYHTSECIMEKIGKFVIIN